MLSCAKEKPHFLPPSPLPYFATFRWLANDFWKPPSAAPLVPFLPCALKRKGINCLPWMQAWICFFSWSPSSWKHMHGAPYSEESKGEEIERWLARGFRVCRETGTRILLRDCGALGRAPPCLVTRDVGRTIKEGFGGPLVRGVGSPLRTDLDMFEFLKKGYRGRLLGEKHISNWRKGLEIYT